MMYLKIRGTRIYSNCIGFYETIVLMKVHPLCHDVSFHYLSFFLYSIKLDTKMVLIEYDFGMREQ